MEGNGEKRIGLLGLAHRFGREVVTNSGLEDLYGLPPGWIKQKTAKEKGHAWEGGEDNPTAASVDCLNRLLETHGVVLEDIQAVFGTTNKIKGDTSGQTLTEQFVTMAGFPADVHVSDQSFGCGGASIGIEAMKEWLENQPEGTHAVYVTQDWSTKMVEDRNVGVLFSDAVSVSIWTNTDKGTLEIGDVFAMESTIADEHLGIIGEIWKMDGRKVSEEAIQVPGLVAEKLGITLSDYDIVPHQPNAKLLETIGTVYDISLYDTVARQHGNPTCSGALIALERRLDERRGEDPDTHKDILVLPFGAGGIGGFILKKKK